MDVDTLRRQPAANTIRGLIQCDLGIGVLAGDIVCGGQTSYSRSQHPNIGNRCRTEVPRVYAALVETRSSSRQQVARPHCQSPRCRAMLHRRVFDGGYIPSPVDAQCPQAKIRSIVDERMVHCGLNAAPPMQAPIASGKYELMRCLANQGRLKSGLVLPIGQVRGSRS